MQFGLRVDAWRGPARLARDLPVVSWAWSETSGEMPSGKLTADFPGDLWPLLVSDPLRPMGQVLRCEVHHDVVTALPPVRVVEVSEGSGVVSVTADTIDLDISEDPWPFPSSPRKGASLLQEASRLAAPLRVRLAIPDGALPEGLAWSGERDEALQELVASRSARWQLDPDGTLTAHPLGSVSEPRWTFTGREITDAPRKLRRDRVSKATVVVQADGDAAAEVLTRRLSHPEYQPDVYGTVGRVETLSSGGSLAEREAAADALLAEGGGQRDFTMTPAPELRAGHVARMRVEHPDGPETVTGRVVSHTLNSSGAHSLTIQEA